MKVTDSIARQYGQALGAAEVALHQAVMGAGVNLSELASANEAGQIGIGVSCELYAMALEPIQLMVSASGAYAKLHDRVSAIAKLNRLEPTSYGFSYMPSASDLATPPDLRVVGEQSAAA